MNLLDKLFGRYKRPAAVVIVSLLMVSTFLVGYASAWTSTNTWADQSTYIGPGSMTSSFSYCIFTDDGGAICAKNGTTGKVDYRGSNATLVIQYVLDKNSDGSKILLAAGIYNIWSLTISHDIYIQGMGRGKYTQEQLTVLNALGSEDLITIKSIAPHSGGGISDLQINGNFKGKNAITIDLALTYTIQDVTISEFTGDAIHMEGGVALNINNCFIRNNQGAGYNASYTDGYGSYAISITSTTFENNTGNNVRCTVGSYIISNCFFENQYDSDHINIAQPSIAATVNVEISNCVFAGTGYYPVTNDAINITAASSVLISGCTFNVARTSINATVNCNTLTIENNYFQYWINWAIQSKANYSIIQSNQMYFTNAGGGGIYLDAAISSLIQGNVINCNNKNYYAAIYSDAPYASINSNYVYNSNSTAIKSIGTLSIINNNYIKDSYSDGIWSSGYECLINDNFVFNADKLKTSSYDGIRIISGGSYSLIDGNAVVGFAHTRYGINLESGTNHCTVSNNKISNCYVNATNDAGTSNIWRNNDVS